MTDQSQPPQPDHSEPAAERQAELRAAYQEGSATPYHGVQIRTLGELDWIFTERAWSGELLLTEGETRANLTGAHLSYAMLTGANLSRATLTGVDLRELILIATFSNRFLNK